MDTFIALVCDIYLPECPLNGLDRAFYHSSLNKHVYICAAVILPQLYILKLDW